MNCSITLRFNKLDQNKNPYQIVLDGISEDSIQDYLNDYSKLLALVKAQGKLEEFLDYSTITGTKGSIYTSKDMEGLKETNNFFAPNITYDKLKKKYGWLPELTPDEKANMNILFVKNLVINGVPAPYVFQTKDLKGNPIYVVQAKGLLDFSRFITKYKTVTDYDPEKQGIPKALNTLLSNIQSWQAFEGSFLRKFADYNTTNFQRNKTRTMVVTDSPMTIAKQLMLSYLPDKMYFYGTSDKKSGKNLLSKNIHKIQLIRNAISSIRGFNNKIVTTNSTLANAVLSKLTYGDSKGAKISIKDFKKLVEVIVPKDQYRDYFRANMRSTEYAQAINTVLNDLFYKNDDGTTNFDTKSYQVNTIKNDYIYFQKSFDTLEDHYSRINIEHLPALAQEMEDYKGYKIYKYLDDNNQTKYTFIRGLLTPQTYDYRITPGRGNELSTVKDKINSMLSPNSRIHSRIYNDLYSDEPNQGITLQIKTYMGQLVPGQIIRVLDYRLPKKSMQGFKDAVRGDTINAIESYLRQVDLLDWFESQSRTAIRQSPLLDDNEKVFLTIATLNSLEGATQEQVKSKLRELINSYGTYRYYKVTNVQDNGIANLVLMSSTNTHMTGEGSYLSVHNELMNFAAKIQDRFNIDTRVLNTEAIKSFIRNNTSYTKDVEVNLLASQRAFVVNDKFGNPIILINSDNARQSDIAHEYMHIFMGIVRANPNLQEQYTQLLTDLISTKEGQDQLQQYQGLSVYKGLAQIDLMEEVAANVMGKYLVNPEKYPNNEAFEAFRAFLEKNTFHQDLSENIIDFSDSINMYDENSKLKQYEIEKANKTNTERLLTNYIQRNMGKQIMEDCE